MVSVQVKVVPAVTLLWHDGAGIVTCPAWDEAEVVDDVEALVDTEDPAVVLVAPVDRDWLVEVVGVEVVDRVPTVVPPGELNPDAKK